MLKPLGKNKASIDLGVENFATIVSNGESIPSLVIKSSHLKSFNQWYNKVLSQLRSESDTLKNSLKEDNEEVLQELIILEKRIKSLHLHRKKWMGNIAHQTSKAIAVYLHKTGHDKVFVGNNILEAKNGSDMSKKVNQKFVQIPFRLILDKLEYKLKWFGIKLVEVDESWTSKSSCVTGDILDIQKKFRSILKLDDNKEKSKQLGILKNSMSGVRITRSLFKDTVINKVIHADVNGAFNILKVGLKRKKLFKNLTSKTMVKLCNPLKYRLFEFTELILRDKATPELFLIRQ